LLANATASGKVYKVNSVLVANVTSAAVNLTCQYHTAANGTGGTSYAFANVISVPSSASLNLIDKNSSFYLMENQSIIGGAASNSGLQVTISYEDIS
jgi:hypothetical protein